MRTKLKLINATEEIILEAIDKCFYRLTLHKNAVYDKRNVSRAICENGFNQLFNK